MKSLIGLILLVFFSHTYAQDLEKDYYINSKDLSANTNHITKVIKMKNGENDVSSVKVDLYSQPDMSQIDLAKLNKIINSISENAKYSLKSPSTYRPNSIVLRKRENDWYTNVFYSGENSFGAKTDQSAMALVSDDGEIKNDFK